MMAIQMSLLELYGLGFSALVVFKLPAGGRPWRVGVLYNGAPVGRVRCYGSYVSAFAALPGLVFEQAQALGVVRQLAYEVAQ